MIRHDSGPDALCFLARRQAAEGLARVPRGSRLEAVRDRLVAGRTLDARLGSEPTASGTFGLLRFVATVPFAASPARWSTNGTLATPTAAGQGVLAAQISPDGASMAVISSLGTGSFRVGLTKPKDLSLKKLKLLPLRGCDAVWRSDSEELAVVESDPACQRTHGFDRRAEPAKPRELRMLAFTGEHPSWQPVRLGP